MINSAIYCVLLTVDQLPNYKIYRKKKKLCLSNGRAKGGESPKTDIYIYIYIYINTQYLKGNKQFYSDLCHAIIYKISKGWRGGTSPKKC